MADKKEEGDVQDVFLPWRPSCDEYFSSYADGIYDEESEYQYIYDKGAIGIDQERGELVIGSAGAGGIYFCFRKAMPGLWAYYPIEERYELKAQTLAELVEGWFAGRIKV
jgi:hypothetical protein